MKKFQGIWLPEHEQHLVEWMAKNGEIVDKRGTYQIKKLRAALEHVRGWRTAVDIGSHVGFWSMHLAPRFARLHAFEPVQEHRECFHLNVVEKNNAVTLHSCALGDHEGSVAMAIPPGSSGGTHVSGEGGEVALRSLDSFALEDVDFVKVDCEGYELQALRGGEQMLKRCQPCVIVEQKEHIMRANFGIEGRPAVDYLQSLGAVLRREISGDFILSWP